MTEITFSRERKNKYKISATGHASGSERVCAAVSGLLYTLSGYLSNSELKVYENRLDFGDAEICFGGGKTAYEIYKLFLVGFLQIEAANSDFLHISCKDISKKQNIF